MTGRRLGDRYELQRRIGAGGMAEVWEATDLSLGRQVAVKMLHPHLADDPAVLSRFRSEAQSAARLTHPGVVGIYDTVSDGGTEAIVMEMVEGRDLRSILDERGSLAIDDAVEVTMQLAQALGAAHQHGIIHRDVKPANIIVRADRRVKLSDFGIAKALGDTTLTESGSFVGTVKYLAPEQIEGQTIDGRADLYSLSIVLFEMICGRPPFPSTDLVAAMDRLKRPAPRATSIRPDIPGRLDEFLARALARDPNDRPADAKTFAASLAAVHRQDATSVETPRVVPPTPTPAPRRAAPTPPKSIPMRAPAESTPPPNKRRKRRTRDVVWPLLAAGLMVAALITVWMLLSPARDVVTDQLQDDTTELESEEELSDTTTTVVAEGGDAETDVAPTDAEEAADSTTTTSTTTTTLPFVNGMRVLAFDPLGDDEENSDKAPLAIDGNPETFWRTEMYNAGRTMGPKEGVGLIIEFDENRSVSGLTTLTNNAGWSARLYEADTPATDLAGWGEPLVTFTDVPAEATLDIPEMTTQAMLVWFTDLGESDEEMPRLELFELTVRP